MRYWIQVYRDRDKIGRMAEMTKEKRLSKSGDICCECFKGSMEDGPFETAEGPFVYCDNCGHKEDSERPIANIMTSKKKPDQIVEPKSTATIEPSPTSSKNNLTLKVVTMPKDANPVGTVFGGFILSLIDQAAFVEARRHGLHRWVTASIEKVDFLKPVRIGDTVSLYAETIKTGTKSVQIGVSVSVERYDTNAVEHVCSAILTMVSVDPSGKSIPFTSPSTIQYK